MELIEVNMPKKKPRLNWVVTLPSELLRSMKDSLDFTFSKELKESFGIETNAKEDKVK